jgi:hypothetical protein
VLLRSRLSVGSWLVGWSIWGGFWSGLVWSGLGHRVFGLFLVGSRSGKGCLLACLLACSLALLACAGFAFPPTYPPPTLLITYLFAGSGSGGGGGDGWLVAWWVSVCLSSCQVLLLLGLCRAYTLTAHNPSNNNHLPWLMMHTTDCGLLLLIWVVFFVLVFVCFCNCRCM